MLSSLTKLSKYTGLSISDGKDAAGNRARLLNWQSAASGKIEKLCNRSFIIQSRTEYFETGVRQRSFFPKAYPVVSITSIKADSLGMFDGSSEWTLSSATDYHLGVDSLWIDINYPVLAGPRGLQIVYTGGLAYHEVRSTFTVSGVSGTPAAGNWCTNSTGTAVGIVRSYTATTTLVVENVYGVFAADDVLSFFAKEDQIFDTTGIVSTQAAISGVAATIASIYQQSLAEAFPALERAMEVEVRYMAKHQLDFENVSTMNDQTQRRQATQFQRGFDVQPETLALCNNFIRPVTA